MTRRLKTLPSFALFASMMLVVASGCGGSEPLTVPVDEQFGHRFDGVAPDGRETQLITEPESGTEYFYYPAVYDTVHIRPEPIAESDLHRVEVLIKGSFPDSCTDLHSIEQTRIEHLINMDLEMRRPKGVVCASVMRPYRFYVILDGDYEIGHYTLKLNKRANTFVIESPESD
ncbi:MAG: hypothetical protein HKN13_07130 [Rhodothermales bacterium]|nr:hypothetical protein [Rhodothermales bacterium]